MHYSTKHSLFSTSHALTFLFFLVLVLYFLVLSYILEGNDAELLMIDIHYSRDKSFVFGVFYRPPSSDSKCLETLQRNLEFLSHLSNFILVGAFNFKDIDWKNNLFLNYSINYELFSDILSDNFLNQMVLQPTRGDNILDLILTNHSDMVSDDQCVPKKSKKKNRCAPWISNDIIKLARKKKRFYKRAKASDNADLWSKYKNVNNMLKKKCNTAQWEYLKDLASNMHDNKECKLFWNYVNSR